MREKKKMNRGDGLDNAHAQTTDSSLCVQSIKTYTNTQEGWANLRWINAG